MSIIHLMQFQSAACESVCYNLVLVPYLLCIRFRALLTIYDPAWALGVLRYSHMKSDGWLPSKTNFPGANMLQYLELVICCIYSSAWNYLLDTRLLNLELVHPH